MAPMPCTLCACTPNLRLPSMHDAPRRRTYAQKVTQGIVGRGTAVAVQEALLCEEPPRALCAHPSMACSTFPFVRSLHLLLPPAGVQSPTCTPLRAASRKPTTTRCASASMRMTSLGMAQTSRWGYRWLQGSSHSHRHNHAYSKRTSRRNSHPCAHTYLPLPGCAHTICTHTYMQAHLYTCTHT